MQVQIQVANRPGPPIESAANVPASAWMVKNAEDK
jgi:hypothetical protein